MAGVFKAISVLCLIMFALGSVEEVDGGKARYIDYGAIKKGEVPGCSAKNPHNCYHGEANPYQRGCGAETRCKQGNPPPPKAKV